MLSFTVGDADAREVELWADRLGIERSEFLRQALVRQLARLAIERTAESPSRTPPRVSHVSRAAVEDWSPAEEWVGWAQSAQ